MKSLTFGFRLLVVLFFVNRGVATEPLWSTQAEIERLSVAIALADFPIKQRKLREVVGISRYAPPLWGSSWNEGNAFNIAALTDPESANGYYALRIIYKDSYEKLPEPAEFDVLGLDVLFVAPNKMTFVSELNRFWREMLPEFRSELKNRGITPREFIALRFPFLGEPPARESESKSDGAAEPK